jgi:hypothetical protein
MLTHKQKVHLARKMRTPAEIRKRIPLFETDAWMHRKETKLMKNLKKAK